DLPHLARPDGRADDALLLHDVDEPARAREADGHLPLEHRHRRLAGAGHDVDRLLVPVVVDLRVAAVLALARAILALEDLELVARVALDLPVARDGLDLAIRDEDALRADRL